MTSVFIPPYQIKGVTKLTFFNISQTKFKKLHSHLGKATLDQRSDASAEMCSIIFMKEKSLKLQETRYKGLFIPLSTLEPAHLIPSFFSHFRFCTKPCLQHI